LNHLSKTLFTLGVLTVLLELDLGFWHMLHVGFEGNLFLAGLTFWGGFLFGIGALVFAILALRKGASRSVSKAMVGLCSLLLLTHLVFCLTAYS
jgi:hypothetical protein